MESSTSSSSSWGSRFSNSPSEYSYYPNTPTPPQMLWQAPQQNFDSYQQYLSSNNYYVPANPSSQLMAHPISFSLNATDAKQMEPVKRVARTRAHYTPEQLESLKGHFDSGNTDPKEYNRIAAELGIQRKQVQLWFKNRRAELKRKNLAVTDKSGKENNKASK